MIFNHAKLVRGVFGSHGTIGASNSYLVTGRPNDASNVCLENGVMTVSSKLL